MNIKNKSIALICLALSLFPVQNFAQINYDAKGQNLCNSVAKTVWGDALYVASSPLRMSKQDAFRLSILAAITTGFIASFDAQTTDEFVKPGEDKDRDDGLLLVGKGLAKAGYVYDDISPGYFFGGLSASMLVGGLICKDEKLLETTRLMAESFIFTGAITSFSKELFGRSRPYTGRGPHDFNFFKFSTKAEYLSMSSGHTSAIFSMMTVIAKQYDQWWIKIPAYTLGISVALQRIDANKHWTSDVILGGALGYWVGSTLVNRYSNRSQAISFNPYFSPSHIGININF